MNQLRTLLAAAIILAVPFHEARAASAVSASEEAASRIKTASAVAALGDDLFGEQVSLYSGSVEFRATDLSLPGNFGLPVALSRRFVVDTNRAKAEPNDDGMWLRFDLGDWELDLPYLAGTYTDAEGWTVGGMDVDFPTPNQRCSSPQSRDEFRPADYGNGVRWLAGEFWGGINFRSPDGNERPVLFRDAQSGLPTPGGESPRLVTRDNWYFTCGVNLSSGQPGEGFVANGPDGSRIYFTHMVEYPERPMSKYWRDIYSYEDLQRIRSDIMASPPSGLDRLPQPGTYQMPDAYTDSARGGTQPVYLTLVREYLRIYPTKVVDRFGNEVNYYWSGDRLTRISSPDGREITLAYGDVNGRQQLVSASDGTSIVNYAYSNGALSQVTLPDGISKWTYQGSSLRGVQRYATAPSLDGNEYDLDYDCAATRKLVPGVGTLEIGHPSGAIGRFEFEVKRHLRSDIDPAHFCNTPVYIGDNWAAYIHFQSMNERSPIADQMTVPVVFDTLSLTSKRISGPGLAGSGHEWRYSYESRATRTGGVLTNGTRRVLVDEPQGQLELVFGAGFMINEGQLLESRRIEDGRILERTVNSYASEAQALGLGLPGQPGLPLTYDADVFGNLFRPQLSSEIHRDGVVFSSKTTAFDDAFGLPTASTKASREGAAVRDSVDEAVEYHHDLDLWVIGQVAKQWRAGKEVSRTQYAAATALPWKTWAHYGAEGDTTPESVLAYCQVGEPGCTPGQLKSSTDALGRTTTLSNWHRGVPRSVEFPDGSDISATVTNQGLVTSVTDQLGRVTQYGYDAMGRVNLIAPPPGWTPTHITVARSGDHWQQTTSKGGYSKVVKFDALLRPIETREWGTGVNKTLVLRQFDHGGREVFVSYPAPPDPDSDTPTAEHGKGITRDFDALGRLRIELQDSEIADLRTRYEYLSGFRTRATNARGLSTVTSFQAFDSPDTSRPTRIEAPEGITTTIERDLFGNPLSITRSGTYQGNPVSLSREYVYDDKLQLCKRIEPESGATVFAYDALGSLAWSAEGTDLDGPACDRGQVALADRILRSYDAMNRLETVTYPDASQNLAFNYFADGQLQSASAGGVTSSYQYNSLGLLDLESLDIDGSLYSLDYGYDSLGNLATLTYPDGAVSNFNPDALGRPRRVGTYALNVFYEPSGAVASFTYGNGILFVGESNQRQLPYNTSYVSPDQSFLYSQDAHYDPNGNVLRSLDLTESRRRERSMAYDDADRLVLVGAGADLGGDETFSYDALDNLRTASRGALQKVYTYSAQNRLQSMSRTGQPALTYTHDSRGRATSRAGVALDFDDGNRLLSVGAVASYGYDAHGLRARRVEGGVTTHFMYSRAGQLVFEKNLASGNDTRYHYLGRRLVAKVGDGPAPIGIGELSVPAASSGNYTVSWLPVAGATRYLLEEQFNHGAWVALAETTALEQAFTGRPVGSYTYRLRACDASACGSYSLPAETQVVNVPVLEAPATSADGNYTVSWGPVADATGYTLQERVNDGAWVSTGPVTGTSKGFSGKPTGVYAYRACATVAFSCGDWSAVVEVQVGAIPEPSIQPQGDIRRRFSVHWTAVGTAASYTLQQRAAGGDWTVLATTTALSHAIELNAPGTYEYRVKGCPAGSCSAPYSRVVSKVLAAAPGITAPATSLLGAFELEWSTVAGATTYRLQSRPSGGSWTTLAETAGTGHALSGLASGTHEFRIAACDRVDEDPRDDCGVWSAVASTVVAQPPVVSVPASNTSGDFTVSWTSVAGATGYALERRSGADAWEPVGYQAGTSAAQSDMATGTYGYRVAACASADACGPASAAATVQVVRPPAVPRLHAGGTDTDGTYSVGWEKVAGATSFVLEESANGQGWVQVYSGPESSFQVTGKTPGGYDYRVKACNLSCSAFSEVSTRWVVPDEPNLAGSSTADGTVSITIIPEPGATNYILRERKGIAWNTVHTGAAGSVELPGRQTGTYEYTAMACNGGCSNWSQIFALQVEVIDIGVPTLSAPASSSTGNYSVSWTSVADATSYVVQERANGGSWSPVHSGAGNSVALSGRSTGNYEYRGQACIGPACGAYSPLVAVSVAVVPGVPVVSAPAQSNSGSYTVSWSTVASATRYELDRRVDGGSWTTQVMGLATSFGESGLANGTYAYRVRACNDQGCSADSAIASTVVLIVPDAPVVSAPATSSNGSYTVSWTSEADATHYRLEERSNGAAWTEVYAGGATSVALSGRGFGQQSYRARACSTTAVASCSAYSAIDSTFVDGIPGLTATTPSASGSYTVSWSEVAGASTYELQEQVNDGSWAVAQATSALNKAFSGRDPGTYAYRVRACVSAGCGSWSGIVTRGVMPDDDPNLAGPASSTTGSYSISWFPVAGATYYRLEEKRGMLPWAEIHNGTATSVARSGLQTATYRYRGQACNAYGCGPYSAEFVVNVTLAPTDVPVVSSPDINGSGGYAVSWTSVVDATSYQLQEQANGGAWSTIHNASGTSKVISGKGNGTYGYRARACNASGCGSWSATRSTQVVLVPSGSPTLSAPSSSSTGSYTVSWTTVSGATSYRLEEATTASWVQVQSSSGTSRAFSGKAAGNYSYRVRACNAGGCGAYSSTKVVAVAYPITATTTLTVPATNTTGIYNVSWGVVTGATYYVLDQQVNGGAWAQAYSGGLSNISYSSVPSGTYGYRVKACNAAGCGPYSTVKSVVVTLPAAIPPTPTGLEVMQSPLGKCVVTWQSSSGATSYDLRAYTSIVYSGATASVRLNGTCAGEYSVRACNSGGCSAWSQPAYPGQVQ